MKTLLEGLEPSIVLSNLQNTASALGNVEDHLNLYALIDAATLDEPFKKLKQLSSEWRVILDGLDDLENCAYGPLLSVWPLQGEVAQDVTHALLSEPSISWIWSNLSLSALSTHLRFFCETRLPQDGTEVFLRFYDPRIMFDWFGVWNKKQTKNLLAPIHAWVWADTQGYWHIINNSTTQNNAPNTQQALQLDIKQQDKIESLSIPGMVLETLRDRHPEWLAAYPQPMQLAMIRELLRISRSYGRDIMSRHFSYLAIALNCHPKMHLHSIVQQKLNAQEQPDLVMTLTELSDAELSRIRDEMTTSHPIHDWKAEPGYAWEAIDKQKNNRLKNESAYV